jgi:hypothetical protein
MLILYNNNYKRINLINICKLFNIKRYSKLTKPKLLTLINKYKAVVYIQNFIRRKFNDENDEMLCPITLSKLQYPFITIKNNNKFRYYSLYEFIEYLNKSTEDFRDPCTRELLSDVTIKQIDNLVKYYKINNTFTKRTWKKKINSRAEYLTLTTCLNEVLNSIFAQSELGLEFIYDAILPQFIYYFHFLLHRHRSSCYSIINNYINCINYHSCSNKIYLIDYLKLVMITNNL